MWLTLVPQFSAAGEDAGADVAVRAPRLSHEDQRRVAQHLGLARVVHRRRPTQSAKPQQQQQQQQLGNEPAVLLLRC